MADDKTAALVVALSAQLTKFENDMKRAGDVADKTVSGIEDRFSKMNPGVATGIGAFLGSLGGALITKAIAELGTLHDRFKQIDETAKLAAISMNDVFGFQAATKGASFAEVDKALITLSSLLDRAQRGEQNNLSTIFSINGVALSSINDAGEAMFKLADIISRLTPIQGLDVLQKLGLPADMLNDLRKGEEHLREIQGAASAAAPDLQALANKAKEFDALWKEAAQNIKAYFIDNLGAVKDSIADFIATTARELRAIANLRVSVRTALGLDDSTGPAGRAADSLDSIAAGLRGDGSTPTRITVRPQRSTANPFPVNDGRGNDEGEDAFERAVAQANKRIAVLNAETGAIGQNSEARERAKLVAALEESAKRANTQAGLENTAVTDAQRAKINELADALENAAAKSRLANEQLAKINSASQTFGSALSSAFADAVVEGKNLNEVFSSLIKTIEKAAINSVFASFFNAPTGGGLSPFAGLFSSIGKNAEGTDNWRGGPTWVGEKGPEIVNLPRGAQVVPNSVARGASGTTFAPVTTIDARGMDPAAVGRFGQIMERHERALQQIAKSMQSSQRFSMTGVS